LSRGAPVRDDLQMPALRVLIAEDHPLYRSAVRRLLAGIPNAELVGEATSGPEAVDLAAELVPDVVVMDLRLPDLGGIEATRRIVAEHPDIGVLVLTMFESDDSVFAAMRAGARGYLLKDASEEDVGRAILAVAQGEAIFGPGVAQRVIDSFAGGGVTRGHPFPELTDREAEVLDLLAGGLGTLQVAKRLSLSDKTVRNHISNILNKLQVTDRHAAVTRARDAGLGNSSREARDAAS
jgi:DNA-binding NarL/FixJ family response regulator